SLAVHKDGAPRYKRESRRPAYLDNIETSFSMNALEKAKNNQDDLVCLFQKVLSDINIASRKAIYEQYDTDIGIMRIIGPGQNAGVYEIPKSETEGSQQAMAVTVDGNGYYVAIEPFVGAMHTVAESYRNLSSSGAEPIGITNCLNFANPYKPENYYFFEMAVKGMSKAAEMFQIPITGGNVSFYNESEDGPVLPTPTIGMVGLLENKEDAIPARAPEESVIYRIGFFQPELSCSRYRQIVSGFVKFGEDKTPQLPALDIHLEKKVASWIREKKKIISGCIDISGGGSFVALAKLFFAEYEASSAFASCELDPNFVINDLNFFGESACSYLIAIAKEKESQAITALEEKKIPYEKIAITGNKEKEAQLKILDYSLLWKDLYQAFDNGLSRYF
ncbi:MAG: hypothetical protein D6767_02385, partial [Candidatus Hydrogenedentota bacterium]